MSTPAHSVRYRYAEYLALDRSSNVKHEYLDGQIYGMAGGSPEHAALTAAVVGLLFPQLAGNRCRAFSSNLRIRIPSTGLATYPDVAVVCGKREHDPEDDQAVTNPTVLVEVLSPSTEEYDRGDKFEHYKRLDSLQQYVLVSERDQCLEVWSRVETGGWTRRLYRRDETAELASISARVEIRQLFDAAAEPVM